MKKKVQSNPKVSLDEIYDLIEDDGEAAFWDEFMKLEEESEFEGEGEKVTIEFKNRGVVEVYENVLVRSKLVRAE